MNDAKMVVFSDLDGALLDERTFGWEGAQGTLRHLSTHGIPLMFVSSKTQAEIETLRKAIRNTDAYAAENGALIVHPDGREQVLGRDVGELEETLPLLAQDAEADLEPLFEMTRARAMRVTGLPAGSLDAALERAYSVPFLLHRGDVIPLRRAAARLGLRILPGKRFLQLVGPHDKGDAVRALLKHHPGAVSIGVGDGPNDLPMLQAVDRPVFQGKTPPRGLPHHVWIETRTGPIGWARAVQATLNGLTPHATGGR